MDDKDKDLSEATERRQARARALTTIVSPAALINFEANALDQIESSSSEGQSPAAPDDFDVPTLSKRRMSLASTLLAKDASSAIVLAQADKMDEGRMPKNRRHSVAIQQWFPRPALDFEVNRVTQISETDRQIVAECSRAFASRLATIVRGLTPMDLRNKIPISRCPSQFKKTITSAYNIWLTKVPRNHPDKSIVGKTFEDALAADADPADPKSSFRRLWDAVLMKPMRVVQDIIGEQEKFHLHFERHDPDLHDEKFPPTIKPDLTVHLNNLLIFHGYEVPLTEAQIDDERLISAKIKEIELRIGQRMATWAAWCFDTKPFVMAFAAVGFIVRLYPLVPIDSDRLENLMPQGQIREYYIPFDLYNPIDRVRLAVAMLKFIGMMYRATLVPRAPSLSKS